MAWNDAIGQQKFIWYLFKHMRMIKHPEPNQVRTLFCPPLLDSSPICLNYRVLSSSFSISPSKQSISKLWPYVLVYHWCKSTYFYPQGSIRAFTPPDRMTLLTQTQLQIFPSLSIPTYSVRSWSRIQLTIIEYAIDFLCSRTFTYTLHCILHCIADIYVTI